MSNQTLQVETTLEQVLKSLEQQQPEQAAVVLQELHYADQAEIFYELEPEQQAAILPFFDPATTADLLEELEDEDVLEVVENIPAETLADVLDEMEPDEAADLLGDLPPEQASDLLSKMEEAQDVLPLLEYEDETAGGLMTTSFIALNRRATVAQAIEFLRQFSPEDEVPYYLYVIDRNRRLIGIVGLRVLVVAAANSTIEQIMNKDVVYVLAGTDQEEVAHLMARYDLSALPVVNQNHELVGVITYDDIMDVVEEEATEDIYRMANVVGNELTPESPIFQQLRGRLPWLVVNTGTAAFAAWVVSHYEVFIAQVAALAVFQSMIAGQGGNSASQNVAMIVRTLGLGEKIDRERTWEILWRQVLVGLLQGVFVGLLVGLGAYLWRGNFYLGLVVGLAMIGNLLLGGIIGTLAPIVLERMGQDPALASSIVVTAVTDSGGFFIFFSLAVLFLEKLK